MFGKTGHVSFFHKIRTLLLAFLAAFALFIAVTPQVLAQNPPSTTFRNTSLSVYPEYDHPAGVTLPDPMVLVMYRGEVVSNNLSELTFLVPSNVFMYSAGFLDPQGNYVRGDSLNTTGTSNLTGWNEVSFVPRASNFVVEYYAPISSQPDRSIPFEFHSLYPVSNMQVIVQEPKRSTNFKVSPEGTVGSDSEGFKVHTYNIPTVTPDKPLLYNITYTKNDTNPSKGGASSNTTLILIVIAAIVVLGVFLFFLPQIRANSRRTGSRSQRRQAERTARKDQGKSKFCRDCGKPVKDNDRFCPSCGRPL